MTNKQEPLNLESPEDCRAWLIAFEAHCRIKGVKDEIPEGGTSPKLDSFLERCGTKSLLKIVALIPGKDVTTQKFSKVKEVIEQYVEPRERLIIADRTTFMQMSQQAGETELDFLARINEMASHCKWEQLKTDDPTETLTKLRFIAGLIDESLKLKVLEKVQNTPEINVQQIVDFCQMTHQLRSFVSTNNEATHTASDSSPTTTSDNFHISRTGSRRNCGNCGTSHQRGACPAYGRTCYNCNRRNHFAHVCRQAIRRQANDQQPRQSNLQQQTQADDDTNTVDVFTVYSKDDNAIMQTITIMNCELLFQIDTGAAVSILSEYQYNKLGKPKLKQTLVQPRNFDGSLITTLGELHTDIIMNNDKFTTCFIVVKSSKQYGLIGRNIIDSKNSQIATYSITEKPEPLPEIKGFTASIKLADTNQRLKFCKARLVPINRKEAADHELEILECQGIISPLEYSQHASPVVWSKKKNGRYRMCVDFKATLNDNILMDSYPMPTAEEIFGHIGNASKFAKIDLTSAYSQIALNDEAKELSVINTHRGLYTVNRLQMGMRNSSAIFQRCMEQILKGLAGVIAYQDDIMIFGDSRSHLKKRLDQVKKRLRDHNVTVNTNKCVDETDSLKFLGFIFSANGYLPTLNYLVKSQMPRPLRTRKS